MLEVPCMSERVVKDGVIFKTLFRESNHAVWDRNIGKNKLLQSKLDRAGKVGLLQLMQVLFFPCWKETNVLTTQLSSK